MEKYVFVNIAKYYLCLEGRSKTAFSCTASVLGKHLLGATKAHTQEHYLNCGFSGICLKPKMTPFFEKGVFGDGWNSAFYYVWFWKAVLCWKHNLFVDAAFAANKVYVEKNRRFVKHSGLFLNMAKRCFCLGFFVTCLVCGDWLCDVCLFLFQWFCGLLLSVW